MSILDRMNLPQKLTIMSVVFLFIAAIPATFYTNSIFSQLDTTGIASAHVRLPLVTSPPEHLAILRAGLTRSGFGLAGKA